MSTDVHKVVTLVHGVTESKVGHRGAILVRQSHKTN
jgi:hypothetical protein